MPEGFWARPDMRHALLTWDIPPVLAAVLRELRWTQRQMADVLGFSQSWVSNVLRREQSLTLEQGHAIVIKFGAPLPNRAEPPPARSPSGKSNPGHPETAHNQASHQPKEPGRPAPSLSPAEADHRPAAPAADGRAIPLPGELAPLTILLGSGLPDPDRPALAPIARLLKLAQQPAASLAQREELYEELARVLAAWAGTFQRDVESSRRLLLSQSPASNGIPADVPLMELADAIRREMEDTLASGTVSPARLAHVEEIIASHVRLYTTTPPATALAGLLMDFMDLRRLLADRQPALVQGRLSEIAALLATLAADSLMKLGYIRQSSAWYGTARIAADDSGNRELRARVRAQQAMLPYYYGNPAEVIRLAHDAQEILDGAPRAAGALAAAAEARAQARMGHRPEAETAMARAQALAEQLYEPDDDQAFRFGERRHLFYLSGTLTNLGQADQARKAQATALTLYGDTTTLIDPALIRLDQAHLLILDHDLPGSCTLIRNACLSLSPQYRTQVLSARARQITDATPRDSRERRILDGLLCELFTPIGSAEP